MINYVLLVIAVAIIAALGFYAGKVLFQLKQQNLRQQRARQARVANIMESVQTIALAVEQQQCNLSEGAIRLVNLLDCLPVGSPPNCERDYPALFALYTQVRELPTHQARSALDSQVRIDQDKQREEQESLLESKILKEIEQIRTLDYA